MNNPFGITTRKCTTKDKQFFCSLTQKTLWPFVSKYVTPDPRMTKDDFDKNYKEIKILMKGKRRIGFYRISPRKNTLYIHKIFLSPTYHGKGIGAWFMRYFETQGHKQLQLHVWENNPAVKFYKKLGYKVIEKKKHKLLMEKKLQKA